MLAASNLETSNGIQMIFAYVLLTAFFLIEFFLRKDKTAKNIDATEKDNKSTKLIGLTFFIVLIVSVVFNLLKIGTFHNNVLSVAGIIVMVVGLFMRVWSMATLNRYYTRTLITVEQQSIITKGPYKIIRHPGYLGTMFIWSGAGIAMRNIVIFAIGTILMAIVYYYRIQNEEKMLQEQFGRQYLDYQKHSWKLIPLLW